MEIRYAVSFGGDYKRLPHEIRKLLAEKFKLLLNNMRHPSLRTKKMQGHDGIWEARITKGYRFTFQKENYGYLLRRVGPHDILRNP